jgi:hypothetical protein
MRRWCANCTPAPSRLAEQFEDEVLPTDERQLFYGLVFVPCG